MQGLGFLTGGISRANDISADGSVIVGSSYQSGDGFHAVVWTASGGLQKLEDILKAKGITSTRALSSADKVSADGRWILGHSDHDVFLAYIDPDIKGTSGPDRLTGTPGNDVIDGMGGADVMTGLAGNDTYFVDVANDTIVEAANEGSDTASSSATYTLPTNVEKLILTGKFEIDGIGNALDNTLTGNSANNVIYGKLGDDIIRGGVGNDWLIGGHGSDTLTGGSGRDRYVFNAALGDTNVDKITDFAPADDVIRLANAVFVELPGLGTLAESAFVAGTIATSAAHRILYDAATGDVRYDPDGTGRIVPVRFVTLVTKPALTSSNFYVQ